MQKRSPILFNQNLDFLYFNSDINFAFLVSATTHPTDCYNFGMPMPGRNANSGDYRYGFNGYEKDDEVKGNGNHLSFADFGYDPRLARRWNMDPLWKSFPYQSPYVYALNNPIKWMDVDGFGPGDGTLQNNTVKTKSNYK